MTQQAKEQFCDMLANHYGVVSTVCTKMNISRTCAYGNRIDDPDFAAAWDAAVVLGVEQAEDEAMSRAVGGSDTLLMFILKGAKPEKYRERREVHGTMNHAGAGGAALPQAVVNVNIAPGAMQPDPSEV